MTPLIHRLLPYIFIVISSIVILGANPFAGETVAPTDILANQPGWQNLGIDIKTRHPARTDILDARMPRWIHAKTALRNGELPIWNPNPINGIPGMQWLPAAVFTPAFALFASISDNATGYYFALLTNLLIAATGAYLLLFSMTKSRLAATFGAMVFAYSGFIAAWFYWAHVSTSIWIPWLMWLSYQYLISQRLIYLPWLAIVSALMIFGGFPSVAVYGFFALAILFPIFAPWKDGLKNVSLNALYLGTAIIVAFFITSFSIYSLYEMLQFTQAVESRHGGTPLKAHHLINYVKPLFTKYANVERTVYIGIIPLIFLATLVPLLIFKRLTKNLVFALLLLSISVLIAFGILPKEIITAIPTFNSNNWGRMTILSALAFAIISAELIYLISASKISKRNPRLITSIIILLLTVQFLDMRALFRNFNGPVPASTFFAKTPTIDYLQTHLKPMQSTIADRSYMVSGIFSNYGIPEWFAHGFKTRSERDLMESKLAPNAHRSRTAAAVYCEGVKSDSNMLNLLAIKYLACNKPISKGNIQRTVLSTSGSPPKASGLITPERPLVQYFALPNPLEIDAISLKLATHGMEQAHADIALRLYHDNILIAESFVKASQVRDNRWVDFTFSKRIHLNTHNNRLEIHTLPSDQKGKLSAWLYPMQNDDVYIKRGSDTRSSVVAVKFYLNIKLPDSIIYHRIENNMVLLENTNIKGSGYTLDELDENLKPDFSNLQLLKSNATLHELEYTGDRATWMILPIRHYPGWNTYVNSKPATVTPFLDMLPAIQVSPGDRVIYRYEPKTLYLLSLLSMSALMFTLFLAYRFRAK
ncbi:MAG: hypothetical protein ABW124_11605 [Candidatus Thiodiazotropha sp. 6PLUC9]